MLRPRTFLGIATGFGVSWLGGLILGEYPFTGFTPIMGGFLLGVSIVSVMAYVEGEDPPAGAIGVGVALAAWGIWRAAWIDAGATETALGLLPQDGAGPLPSEAWWALAAAAAGAATRFIPTPRRRAFDGEAEVTDQGDADA